MAMRRASLLLAGSAALRNPAPRGGAAAMRAASSGQERRSAFWAQQKAVSVAMVDGMQRWRTWAPAAAAVEEEEAGERLRAVREAKRLLRLMQVEALKRQLETDGRQSMAYADLLELCQRMGLAATPRAAAQFATALDEAGVVLLFQDTVYLNPHKIAQRVSAILPPPSGHQTLLQEFSRLQQEKQEIDRLAHRHVRALLWSGLGYLTLQTALFFRLTFYDLSWDVMEPIAFFTTTAGILAGYAFFLLTSRDPTYQDLMKRLLSSKQRKLIQKRNFDVGRFTELQRQFGIGPSSASSFIWKQTVPAAIDHTPCFLQF